MSDRECNALVASIEGLGFVVRTATIIDAETSSSVFTASAAKDGVTRMVRGADLGDVVKELAERCGVELEDG